MRQRGALEKAISSGRCSVAVIGQGYVGLSVAAAAGCAGMTVVGIDNDTARIEGLRAGRSVVPGVDEVTLALGLESGRLSFSTDARPVSEADVVLICVPTP